MAKSNRDESWKTIFDKYGILKEVNKNGYYDISAEQINAVQKDSARILAKVDFKKDLPKIMNEENLSILAINNGLYRIARTDPFIDVEKSNSKPIEISFNKNISTINPYAITSECVALDLSSITGIHDIVFGEETNLTIRGRRRADLDFSISGTFYNVKGVQVEVDGGYEGRRSVNLVEAKISEPSDISIRQLLYPQLFWEKEIRSVKDVRAYLFYTYEDKFRYLPYVYDGNTGHFDYQNEKLFRFKDDFVNSKKISDIFKNDLITDDTAPFPQANDFDKVDKMLMYVASNTYASKDELAIFFDIDKRQIDYYFNCLRWMRLSYSNDGFIFLSKKGIQIAEKKFKERMFLFCEIVFSNKLFNGYVNGLDESELINLMPGCNLKTFKRRMGTVRAWSKFFNNILNRG